MDAIPHRFQDRSVIVTGGADGIGAAIARRLLREGARVTLLDANEEKANAAAAQLSQEGFSVNTTVLDVGDATAVDEGFARVVASQGKLDAVVHAAGIVGPNATKATEIDPEDFDEVIRVNLRGSFLVARAALRHMEASGYGRILLFASIAGKEGNAGMSPYSVSKAGVIGLAKSLGKEYAETGITINAIAPAVIRTAMVEGMEAWQVKYMTEKIPMKRCGTLAEAAALSCWLVSEEASFSTGAVFDLSGGRATY
jgi:3-oxoacyl-[acyl-carrier protein] reductase